MDTLYSVKQVAEMLKINEETVRRWIRNKKLIPDIKESNKSQAFISKETLKTFGESMPKYWPLLAGAGVMVPGMATLALAAFTGSAVVMDKEIMTKEDIKNLIELEIEKHKNNIENERKRINELSSILKKNNSKEN